MPLLRPTGSSRPARRRPVGRRRPVERSCPMAERRPLGHRATLIDRATLHRTTPGDRVVFHRAALHRAAPAPRSGNTNGGSAGMSTVIQLDKYDTFASARGKLAQAVAPVGLVVPGECVGVRRPIEMKLLRRLSEDM